MPGSGRSPAPIRALLRLFPAAHLVVSILFVLAALGLLCFAGYELWLVVAPGESAVQARLGHVLDAIALVTIAVASLELGQTIVAVFHFSRDDPTLLPYAATIGITAAALLAGWGVFIRLNESAEQLEPEAMQAAKSEDRKIDESRSKA